MRNLIIDDMFLLSEIADKIDLKVNGSTKEEIGSSFIITIVKKIYLAKEEVKQLIASVMEIDKEELNKKPIKELIPIIKNIINSEELNGFF